MRTLDDLRFLAQSDPLYLQEVFEAVGQELSVLRLASGVPFSGFYQGVPDMLPWFSFIGDQGRSRMLDLFFDHLSKGARIVQLRRSHPRTWQSSTLEECLALERLDRSGSLEEFDDGLLSVEQLIKVFLTFEPCRRDVLASRVIPSESFGPLIDRYGLVAVLNTSHDDDTAHKAHYVLGFLRSVDPSVALDSARFRKAYPDEYALARTVFKRYEWALSDAGLSRNPSGIKGVAYELFTLEGEHAADEFLKRQRYKPHIRRTLINEFSSFVDDFTGARSSMLTSALERSVEQDLVGAGVSFRRQVSYASILPTTRRFVMDFLVGRAVVEVVGGDDQFIHHQNYFDSLAQKRRLAEENGYAFVVVTDRSDVPALSAFELPLTLPALLTHESVCAQGPFAPIVHMPKRRSYFVRKENVFRVA